jgi:tripartite-type tricarboxylate transporter receptor subunit TctC
VVVENKAGAGAIIGSDAAAKAAPDGYTIYLSTLGALALNPHL